MSAMEKPLTSDEVAQLLRVCPETVRRWARSEKLRSAKPGRKRLFSVGDVRKLLDGHNSSRHVAT